MQSERNSLEGQKDKIIELMQNREFVYKISQIEDTSEFAKSFEEKGVSMSEHDAKLVFKEKIKINLIVYLKRNF